MKRQWLTLIMTISLLVALPKGINTQPSRVSLESTHYPLLITNTDQHNKSTHYPLLITNTDQQNQKDKDIGQWIKDNIQWVFPFLGVGGLIGLYKLLQSFDKWRFKQYLMASLNKDLDDDDYLKFLFRNRLKKVLIIFDDKLFDECLTHRLRELEDLSNSSADNNRKIKELEKAFRDCIKVAVLNQEIFEEIENNIEKNPSRLGNLTVSTQIGHMQSEYINLNNNFLELQDKIFKLQQQIDELRSDSGGGQ